MSAEAIEVEDDFDIPEEVETVLEDIFKALQDKVIIISRGGLVR